MHSLALLCAQAENAWKIARLAQRQAQNTKTALQSGQKATCISLNRFYSIVNVSLFQPDPAAGFFHLSKCELLNDTEQWETYAVEDGWRGPAYDFVFAADGSVWVMWGRQYHVAASPGAWGVTYIQANGNLQHYDLNQLTGINAPHSDDAIVLDVYGRLWFIAYQPNPPERFLGILDTDGELATPLYSLGRMREKLTPLTVSRSNLTVDTHGILPDGSGGVYLYNGADLPLRHLRP